MAVTTTPLGFKAPDGNEVVRNGDNAIADNARKAQELIAADRGRLSAIESKNTAQDNRLTGVETKNAAQDGRLTNVETSAAGLTTRMGAAESKNATQDTRLTAAEGKTDALTVRVSNTEATNNTQNNRLTTVENKTGELTTRMIAAESKNGTQDSRLTTAETKNVAQDGRLAAVESKNAVQDSRIGAVETKVTAITAEQTVQNGRLAQVENAAGFDTPPLELSDEVVAALVADTGSVTRGGLDNLYAEQAVEEATDPLAYLANITPVAQFNARPEGTLWPQAFSYNEGTNELYVAMNGSLDGGATNSLRISVRELDGTLKHEKTITVGASTSSEGIPWFYNPSGELCFIIRPASFGVGYAIYNYTTNTVGPTIPIQGNYKCEVEGNLFATCDATTSTSGVGLIYLYNWASVQAGAPVLVNTVRLEVRNMMNKVQSFALNAGHIFFNHGASKTEPYLSAYTMTGKLVTAFQMDKPTFADALNGGYPGTITNRVSYRHESEGAAVYKGALMTGHITDNNTSSYKFTIVQHNRINGARVKTLPQAMEYDTGWIDVPLAAGIVPYLADGTTAPKFRRVGDIIYMKGAVKGLPTNPAGVLIGTLPAPHRPAASTTQSVQATSSGKTANWQVNAAGTIYVLNSQNAGDANSWFPLPTMPLHAT